MRAQAVAAEAQTIGSGTSGDIIGKYERGENIPSIEVAAKIADALGVTLDYLVKEGEYEQIDKATLKRLKDIGEA